MEFLASILRGPIALKSLMTARHLPVPCRPLRGVTCRRSSLLARQARRWQIEAAPACQSRAADFRILALGGGLRRRGGGARRRVARLRLLRRRDDRPSRRRAGTLGTAGCRSRRRAARGRRSARRDRASATRPPRRPVWCAWSRRSANAAWRCCSAAAPSFDPAVGARAARADRRTRVAARRTPRPGRRGIPLDEAKACIASADGARRAALRDRFGVAAEDTFTHYDLVLNTEALSIEAAAALVVDALRRRRFPLR